MTVHVPRLWMDNQTLAKRKRSALQGYSEFLQVERFILLEIGFLHTEGAAGWDDILVGLVEDDGWRVGSFINEADNYLCIYITSGMLLSLLEVTTVALYGMQQREGQEDGRRGLKRADVGRLFRPPGTRSTEGSLEREWGDCFMALDDGERERASEMARMSILFILHHEMAHHLRRHSVFTLGQQTKSSDAPDDGARRFLEIDADLHAAQFVAQRLLAGPFSLATNGKAVKHHDWVANLFDAVALLFILEDVRINKGLNESDLIQVHERNVYPNVHPIVRWGLSIGVLRRAFDASEHLQEYVTVPMLDDDFIDKRFETAGRIAMLLGMPQRRWQAEGNESLWEEVIAERRYWGNYLANGVPDIQNSLNVAYKANDERRPLSNRTRKATSDYGQ